MIYDTVAIYDSKTRLYSHVMNFINVDEAVRTFGLICANPDTDYAKFPVDYSLFHIGKFDSESGLHLPLNVAVLIKTAIQCMDLHKMYYQSQPDAVPLSKVG